MSLKSFIKSVRATKTLAEERAVIQKESAALRTSFREESSDAGVRRNNVARLLYLFTLGERTHFGQIECLKLLASPRFADKRLGYLGTMLLLDENQEVLTLVTNSIQNDLNHPNQYVVGLALCTLGNIASQEMARDLFGQVEGLMATSNPYIRRKAALCAMRIIRKVPDLQEHFIDKAKLLLTDRNHGVLLCGITLVTDICTQDADAVAEFKAHSPLLIKQLKSLTTAGYAPEHDVSGITDPFLQVKILRLLRVLGRDDAEVSEGLNDILAQVATNTDGVKNVGNSILYETVLTIFDIQADSGLRVLGVNILGKFLANKDNNIRYVALNTLSKVVAVEPSAVQRHRNTILDCLRDPDISIRRRAMDLSFTLVNEQNVRVLIRELLAFLEVANSEFKPVLTTQICIAAEKYAPNKRWHIDTVLRVVKLAGNYVKEEILSSFIRLIATTRDLQTYAAQRLYSAMRADLSQEGLVQAGAWVIGEFADQLLKSGGVYEDEKLIERVGQKELVDLLESVSASSFASRQTEEYVITAFMKLTTHLSEAAQIERVRRMLLQNTTNIDVEIQQRAVEYGSLFGQDAELRRQVLERMPPPPMIRQEVKPIGRPSRRKADLVDLMGEENGTMDPVAVSNANNTDLLADLFGDSPAAPPAKSSESTIDLFGDTAQPAPSSPTATTAFEGHDTKLTFQNYKESESRVSILARFHNSGSPIEHFNLQVAVARSQTLVLQPPSQTSIPSHSDATQTLKITASPGVGTSPSLLTKARLRLKLKLSITRQGNTSMEQVMFEFPESIL